MQNERTWNGSHIFLMGQSSAPGKPIALAVSKDVASKLALSLKRLQNTTLMVPPEVEELITALDYVLVGDPASTNTHKALQAKRPYPDSPSDADFERDRPDHKFVPHEMPSAPGHYRCGYARSKSDASTFCWKTEEEHL